jgi:hypothetical protein
VLVVVVVVVVVVVTTGWWCCSQAPHWCAHLRCCCQGLVDG